VVDPGDHVVDLGSLDEAERKTLDSELHADERTITICRASSDVMKPYGEDAVTENSIIEGKAMPAAPAPVFPATSAAGVWGDIIPPFDYLDGHYPGMNWTADGQDIWKGGCLIDLTPVAAPQGGTTTIPPLSATTSVPPSSPTTAASTPSTTALPAATALTTTSLPSGSTATTAAPSLSTSTPGTSPSGSSQAVVPATTPTTSPDSAPPPVAAPPAGESITPPVEAEVVDPADHVVVLGQLNTPERATLDEELHQTEGRLAFTGAPFVLTFTVGGLLLLLAGGVLLALERFRRHSHS
jgi:hypothetical protein